MNKLLRCEGYRFIRSGLMIVAVIAIIVADLFLNSRCQVNSTNLYSLPDLCTSAQFLNYADNSSMGVSSAVSFFVKRGELESSDAEDLLGVFQDIHPYQFRWILSQTQGMLLIPLIFAVMFLARDFDERVYMNALGVGHSRGGIFAAKAICLLIGGFLVSFAGMAGLTGIYANAVFAKISVGYGLSRMALHSLCDVALIAPALFFVCLFRKTVPAGILTIVYSVLIRFTEIIPLAHLMHNKDVWAPGGNVLPLVLWSVGTIAVCAVLSGLLFKKASLK